MPEVAPRIRRVGTELVSSYLVEDGGQLVAIDAGLPSYWNDLQAELAAIGKSFEDVRAVLLTHGHGDHIGFAERARRAGVTPRIHHLDAMLARGEVGNEVSIVGPKRLAPTIQFLVYATRRGYGRTPRLRAVDTFDDGATLDVPGTPRVIHVPGHTRGSSALLFEGHSALFVGDSINTYSVLSGRRGPQLSPFNTDRVIALESLDRLADLDANYLLTGHGAVWSGGPRRAVELAREAAAV